jgi:hypothetical protein
VKTFWITKFVTPARVALATGLLGVLVLAAVQASPVTAKTAQAAGLRSRTQPVTCWTQPTYAGYPDRSEWVVHGQATLVTDGLDNWFQDGTATLTGTGLNGFPGGVEAGAVYHGPYIDSYDGGDKVRVGGDQWVEFDGPLGARVPLPLICGPMSLDADDLIV